MINANEKNLLIIERQFKKIANISHDISTYPLSSKLTTQVKTDKNKSKKFSEVFTPLWLVDRMISQVKWNDPYSPTLDLCAGYGQFSVRLMRHHINKFPDFKLAKFIKSHHFSELQLSSCYKLLMIFNIKINLFIGDSIQLNKLPTNAFGIWIYLEKPAYWVCLTQTITNILCPNGINKPRISEEKFVSQVELLVNFLNKEYEVVKEDMSVTLEQMKRSSETRLVLFKHLNNAYSEGKKENSLDKKDCWQQHDTDQNIVTDLCSCIDDLEHKTVLVLFNCEIVEQLIHKYKIPADRITFAADFGATEKAKFVKAVYGVDYKIFTSVDFMRVVFGGKKFDVVLSNPPFNRGLDLKIMDTLLGNATLAQSIAREFVIVHPSTWLIDLKGKTASYTGLKNKLSKKIRSVKLFNGNPVFDIDQFVPCSITNIDISFDSEKINVEHTCKGAAFPSEKFIVDNIFDITKFGSDYLTIVKPFMKKMKAEIAKQSHIWSHNIKTVVPNKSYCQSAAIIGNHGKDKSSLVKDDFYTLTIRGSQENKGIRMPNLNRPGNAMPTWGFDTDLERDNFLVYLNTDFARFCLACLKNNNNTSVGEMELIPWMDFTQSWDDEKLFKHFDVNQETQDYIRKFLPDYYGLRKEENNGSMV